MTPSRPSRHPTTVIAAVLLVLTLPTPLLAADKPHAAADGGTGHGAAPAAKAAKAAAQVKPAAAAATDAEADAEPIEQLRQRLAERLTAPGAASIGTLDLRLRTTPPAAPAHKVAATPRAAAAHAPAAHAAAAIAAPQAAAAPARKSGHGTGGAAGHAAPHWAYDGPAGPATWGGLRPDFGLCANGQRQSPIDIRGGLSVELEPVKFDYQASRFSVVDNGHTVQVNLPMGNAIEVGGRRFELVQFHFHRPSEERIDGRQFEMSLHLVHKDAQGKLAVVGVLLDRGPAHPAVQMVWNHLPLEKHEESNPRAMINPVDLLPADRRYYTYMGSLTTPPCSEGVLWVVMRTPVTVTAEQVALFARIYPMNARPVQSAAGRRIMQSE